MRQKERISSFGGTIPAGMTLGWTCSVPYCYKPEHFRLVEDKNYLRTDYSAIRAQLCSLKDGEYFDVEVPGLIVERDFIKFRSGLKAGTSKQISVPHFLIRTLCRERIRIIRTGNFHGDANEWREKYDRPTERKRSRSKMPANHWMGLLAFSGSSGFTFRKCSEKGCAFPVAKGCRGKCSHHHHFDDFVISMTDSALDMSRMYNPSLPFSQGYDFAAEYPISTENLERSLKVQRSSKDTTGYHKELDDRHKNAGLDLEPRTIPGMRLTNRPYPKRRSLRKFKMDDKTGKEFIPKAERVDGDVYGKIVDYGNEIDIDALHETGWYEV